MISLSAFLCGHCFTLFFFWLFIYESASRIYIDLDRTTVAYILLSSRFSFLVDLVLVLVPCILHVFALHLCVMHFIAPFMFEGSH